jgi:hypothetical protein
VSSAQPTLRNKSTVPPTLRQEASPGSRAPATRLEGHDGGVSVARREGWRRWSLVAAAVAVLLVTPVVVAALPVRVCGRGRGGWRRRIAGWSRWCG